jgi:hypothetical protein
MQEALMLIDVNRSVSSKMVCDLGCEFAYPLMGRGVPKALLLYNPLNKYLLLGTG